MVKYSLSYKLRKYIYILFMVLLFTSCSNNNHQWQNPYHVIINSDKLQAGDIIVKRKIFADPMSWMGHSSIMISDTHIGDFPMPGKKFYTINVKAWLNEENREVIVLRYPNFDETFKNKFLENYKKYGHGQYSISLTKKKEKDFYCSKFVWFLYYKTAKNLGYELDLDESKGIFVFPYDFLDSKQLKQIQI